MHTKCLEENAIVCLCTSDVVKEDIWCCFSLATTRSELVRFVKSDISVHTLLYRDRSVCISCYPVLKSKGSQVRPRCAKWISIHKCKHWMTGETAPLTEEDKDAATEPAPKWTVQFEELISKDPEGWDLWVQAITSSAKSRSAFQEDVLSKVMNLLIREWDWSSPRKIGKSQIRGKLKHIMDWGSTTNGSATSMLSTALEDILIVMEDNNKSKLDTEEGASTKRIRTNASGNRVLEQHCLRTGDGNNPDFLEHITEYVRSNKASWSVKDRMVTSGMWSLLGDDKDVLSFDMVPEKHVFVLMEAGNDWQKTQNVTGGVFVYVDVTECRPRWLTEDHLFGKSKSLLDAKVVPFENQGQEAVRQLMSPKIVKPLWFHSDGQFWACWEIMMVAYVACNMMTENQVKVYRHLLQQIQEEGKREGRVPMTMWLYDMNVRKFLANRSEYDGVSLEVHKQNVFRSEDKILMRNTMNALPEYQAAFKLKTQSPAWWPTQKKEEEKPKISLTRAEELARQETKENQGFVHRMQAARANKAKAWERQGWGSGKFPREVAGEGHKFYDDNNQELKGNAKKQAWTNWHKGVKQDQKDKSEKDKWKKDSRKGGWHS